RERHDLDAASWRPVRMWQAPADSNGARSVPGVRIGAEEELDVRHALGEAVEADLLFVQQRVSGYHDFPLAVPHAAAEQAAVGELRGHRAVEIRRIIDRPESLVLAADPELFIQAALRREELDAGEVDRPDVLR